MSNPLLRFTFPVGRIFLIDPVKLGKTGLPMNPVGRGKTTHFSSDFCVAADIIPHLNILSGLSDKAHERAIQITGYAF